MPAFLQIWSAIAGNEDLAEGLTPLRNREIFQMNNDSNFEQALDVIYRIYLIDFASIQGVYSRAELVWGQRLIK